MDNNKKINRAARIFGLYYILLLRAELDMEKLITVLSTNNKKAYREIMANYSSSELDIEYIYKNRKFELRKLKKIYSLLQAVINQDLSLYDPKWNNRSKKDTF